MTNASDVSSSLAAGMRFMLAGPSGPIAELAAVAVHAGGRESTLGAALGVLPVELTHPLWGVVAVWDAERSRHIVNWDVMSVLVDPPGPEDWVRRQLLLEIVTGQPLDWELIGAALEEHPVFADRPLAREQGGRVRSGDDGGWIAEHGTIERPIPVARCVTIPAALAALEASCMAARAELRHLLAISNCGELERIATAAWWAPRYQVWATVDELSRSRTWDRHDVITMLDVTPATDVLAGRLQLPPPEQAGGGCLLDRWHQETVIAWAMGRNLRLNIERTASPEWRND